jgi:hypothetical protein
MLSFSIEKISKSLLSLILIFQFIGCASYMHGYTTSRYQGQWLKVSKDDSSSIPGNIRLEMEREFDPALDVIVASKGLPDYIHVIDRKTLELVYMNENRIYQYERPTLSVNSMLVKTYEATEAVRAGHIPELTQAVKNQASIRKSTISDSEPISQKEMFSESPFLNSMRQNKWAIIIGISKYQFSGNNGLTDLIFADDDAKAFTRCLYNLNWPDSRIKLLVNENATERNIRIALESWLTKAGPNDQIVLFWAGHGYTDPEDPEKIYLATYDTNIAIPATGYRMDRVRTVIEEIGAKNVLILADTCHAGKLITRGKRAISIVPQIDKMHHEQNVPKGWVFMVGADTDRQAIEHSSWSNGAFTHSLIKGLSGEADGFLSSGAQDGIVTMGELKTYMNTAMPDETQKVLGVAKRPVITTSTGDPDIWNLTLQISP